MYTGYTGGIRNVYGVYGGVYGRYTASIRNVYGGYTEVYGGIRNFKSLIPR